MTIDYRTIDVHAHILPEETIGLLQKAAPSLALRIQPLDDGSGVLQIAGITQKPFPREACDLERRFRDMDQSGVAIQLLSNIPQTFLYEQEASLGTECAIIQNDQIAALVKKFPERFRGLATLPMQAPEMAARELRRAMGSRGLLGFHLASNIRGRNLDDPTLEPVWETAQELGAFVFVHPFGIAASDRLKSYYLKNLIGNPLDTTIAAASLIFGGVIERYPDITFCFAHGGVFAPYQAGRFIHGWNVRPEPKQFLKRGPAESLGRIYYDTILHSDAMLQLLIGSVGASRVMLGSDYPFDMGYYEGVRQVRSLSIPESDQALILGKTAE
ncbi:MAG: amidohydrolase family protein, partial [Candidatus Aminicenantales bacterium]